MAEKNGPRSGRTPDDFYEIQKRQWAKSLGVFALVVAFHILAFGGLILIGWIAVGALGGRLPFQAPGFWVKFWLIDAAVSLLVALLQYYDARKFGGSYILKRLAARPPDRTDRYHLAFENAVEEIRLAAGLPKVRAYVLPDWAVNSLAVIEADGTPAVAVTEGLLADFARDELEAVAAHEIAHIARGDAFFLTFICAMANFFERIREMFEPDFEEPAAPGTRRTQAGGSIVAAFAALSSLVVRMLGVLVSRERELLADAAAVELGRSPEALARAIFKADAHNSFVGDFNRTYGPLFIVPPKTKAPAPDTAGSWPNTHPSVARRMAVLADMAHSTPEAIVARIADMNRDRDRAKVIFPAYEELHGGAAAPSGPAVGTAAGSAGLCPRCRLPLADALYEGVPVRVCRECLGKLVDQDVMDRILARTEIGFSPALVRKAEELRQNLKRNPLKSQKRLDRTSAAAACPACGYRLASRPYNYQYFIPVEKCLSCGRIWFDADEMEILQILVEQAKSR
jgi:Zn-dependent protease with chaperone function/Zn-finger nucleic acid-binding protein